MLSPVRAASNVSLTSQKQAAIVGENLTGVNTIPAAIALSGTIDASVEGKLNMLLLAARARMVDSLLAVIDTASKSIGLRREAGESNATFALRIADAIRDLTPKQLATVQQQLNAQGQTIPLQLIAQALHNPTGPQAAQIVAYIELVRYKDLATRAVVNSYGQNGGMETQELQPSVTAQPPRQDQGVRANPPPQSASSERPSSAAPASFAASLFAEAAEVQQVEVAEQVLTGGSLAEEVTAEDKRTADPQQPKATATSDRPATPVLRPAAATATVMPGEIRRIAADTQEGLKIVVARVLEAAGPELLEIMAEGEQAADAILAQALIADVLDGEEMRSGEAILQKAATPEKSGGDRPAALSNTTPPPTENDAERAPPNVGLSRLFDEGSIAPPILAESQVKAVAPLPQGIPFAVAQYLPAPDDAAESSSLQIDRVDPVEDEEQGQSQSEPHDEEEEEQGAASDDGNEAAMSQSTDAADEETAEASAPMAAAGADDVAPEPKALPMAAPVVPVVDPAYNLYQRMAGWE